MQCINIIYCSDVVENDCLRSQQGEAEDFGACLKNVKMFDFMRVLVSSCLLSPIRQKYSMYNLRKSPITGIFVFVFYHYLSIFIIYPSQFLFLSLSFYFLHAILNFYSTIGLCRIPCRSYKHSICARCRPYGSLCRPCVGPM